MNDSKRSPVIHSREDFLAAGSMCVLTILVLIRALSVHEPFPMWDFDPFIYETPLTGITAGYGVLLNTVIMLLGAFILVTTRCASKVEACIGLMLGVGCAGLSFHLTRDPESLVNGTTLGAMIVTILASRSFIRAKPEWSRILIPIVLGSSIFLGFYGLHQVYIQHPQTVEVYEQNRDVFLESRGWTDGSFEVQTYERRLKQPEPTGWFGLANVYASFVAAFGIAMVMVTLCSIRKAWWIGAALCSVLLLMILAITKSKGAIGAAVFGFVVIQYVLTRTKGRLSRVGSATLASCVLVMFGVVAGAMLQQLSLQFRGQYIVGALRIFAEHPLIGVGPAGFQDAYMIHKPATSPEDVTSAHNILFDLLAQLGVTGVAWIVLIAVVLWSSRLPVEDGTSAAKELPKRLLVRIVPLIVLLAGLGCIRLQSRAMDVELMLVLLMGIGTWMCLSVLLSLLPSERALRIAMLSAGIALMLHAMLDLTPVWTVSAPLFGLCIGMGFVPSVRLHPKDLKSHSSLAQLVGVFGLGTLIILSGIGSSRLIIRDSSLIRIGQEAQQVAQIKSATLSEVSQQLERLGYPHTASSAESVMNALASFEIQQRIDCADAIIELDQGKDEHLTILALEHALKTAMLIDQIGNSALNVDSTRFWSYAELAAERLSIEGATFSGLKWAGDAQRTIAHRDGTIDADLLNLSLKTWLRADSLNPHDPKHALRLMDLFNEVHQPEEAKRWAQIAIDRSSRMKLDPLKQLRSESLARARAIINQN